MSALAGRAVWVVGASSGIGAAVANELTARGARVAISARRADQLDEVAGHRMSAVPLDVTDRIAVDAAADEVAEHIGAPDLPMAVLMKIARLVPVRLWAGVMHRVSRPTGR